jgi:hypothetical protein
MRYRMEQYGMVAGRKEVARIVPLKRMPGLGRRFTNYGNKNLNFIENVEGPTQRVAHATAHPVCHVRDNAEDYIKLRNYYN